jgi:hypothetical protein
MKRKKTLVGMILMSLLVLLVALPVISRAEAPDEVTISRAICAPAKGKWRVMGTALPGRTVTVYLDGSVIGKPARVAAHGRWAVVVNNSAIVAAPGDSVTATSSGGGTASQEVLVR